MKKKKKTTRTKTARKLPKKKSRIFVVLNRIAHYFTTKWQKIAVMTGIFVLGVILGMAVIFAFFPKIQQSAFVKSETSYWMVLHRKSNTEYLYLGIPGAATQSILVRTFRVKTGIPGERPTPLPSLVGREYWFITEKMDSSENPETAPYFLTLNVPGTDFEPFGPVPYLECGGEQCFWELPGAFGLHGVNGDESRLATENPGSSGCVRHADSDITYLYNLLEPEKEPVRYYVFDI